MELQKLIDGLKAHRSGAASYESVDDAIRVFEAMRDVDGEKAVKGLECHMMAGCFGADCPYELRIDTTNDDEPTCSQQLCRDALSLIRQQQERIAELEAAQTARLMTLEEVHEMSWDYCYLEEEVIKDKVLQMYCGAYRVKCITWPGIASGVLTFGDDAYGRRWRCWTQRPTDEQREVTPWY